MKESQRYIEDNEKIKYTKQSNSIMKIEKLQYSKI